MPALPVPAVSPGAAAVYDRPRPEVDRAYFAKQFPGQMIRFALNRRELAATGATREMRGGGRVLATMAQ